MRGGARHIEVRYVGLGAGHGQGAQSVEALGRHGVVELEAGALREGGRHVLRGAPDGDEAQREGLRKRWRRWREMGIV